MVSRQTTRPLRKLVPAVALGFSALLGIVGCSAGQVAQTADMEPAVNGNTGQVGEIALRDVMIAFPESGKYQEGDDAPLVLTIVNTGATDDKLVGVSSPAGSVEILGNPSVPGRTALQVVLPADNPAAPSSESSAPETTESSTEPTETSSETSTGSSEPPADGSSSTAAPTSVTIPEETVPDIVGTISLMITKLSADLPFGKNVPVTFEFANAGRVTIQLPIAAPSTPRPEATEVAGEH
jgi:copper(I)-binding protein